MSGGAAAGGAGGSVAAEERATARGSAGPGGRRRSGRRGEQAMVPDAEFRSYYGRQVIHSPAWVVPDVPAYLYLGGLAGVSATMAGAAEVAGLRPLARRSRLAAALGATASVAFLVHDLGMPSRFLNMLRVFKPTSPLSVGSWILAPFSTFTAAAAVAEHASRLPGLRRVSAAAPRLVAGAGAASGAGAAVLGPAMSTYTAVLLADTAVPAWHEAYPELPFVFAGSAMASAGGVGLLTSGPTESGPARRVAVTGAALELAASARMEHRLGLVGEPYSTGRSGRLVKASRVLTAGGAVALLAGRSRTASAVAGVALNAGSLLLRFGVFDAGVVSARDPKYTVVPQRERLEARRAAAEAAAAAAGTGTGTR